MINTEKKKPKHVKQSERALAGPVTPILLTVEEASIFLGIPVPTLNALRARTPKYLTEETFEAEIKKKRIPPIPFIYVGKNIKYDMEDMKWWRSKLPRMGVLLKEVSENEV